MKQSDVSRHERGIELEMSPLPCLDKEGRLLAHALKITSKARSSYLMKKEEINHLMEERLPNTQHYHTRTHHSKRRPTIGSPPLITVQSTNRFDHPGWDAVGRS